MTQRMYCFSYNVVFSHFSYLFYVSNHFFGKNSVLKITSSNLKNKLLYLVGTLKV